MRRHLMLLGLAFAVGFLAGCQEEAKPLLGPENALEVVNAQDTFSLRIDDPSFPQRIRAALFQNANDPASWSLRWSR